MTVGDAQEDISPAVMRAMSETEDDAEKRFMADTPIIVSTYSVVVEFG